jgi:F-type H+-transporting ATPase subunit delta
MRGVSQTSYQAVQDGFATVLAAAGAQAAELGEQLFAVVDALDASGGLRRALSDPARTADDKADLVRRLLAGKADPRVVDVVAAAAAQRWSAGDDLAEALERLAAETVLAAAQAEGALDRVEEELFRFDRLLAREREVREALTDRMATPDARAALVERLIGQQAHPATLGLVVRAARAPRGRSMMTTLTLLSRLAAHRRERLLATVTAAVMPTPAQVERLRSLLAAAYGRTVQVNVAVDPSVVGGLHVTVGDEVVDATVLSRLDEVRRRLAG